MNEHKSGGRVLKEGIFYSASDFMLVHEDKDDDVSTPGNEENKSHSLIYRHTISK